MKGFGSLIKKDIRLLVSGKFFLMSIGFLIVYTLYVNLGYVRLMDVGMYHVYLYDPQGTQETISPSVYTVPTKEEFDAVLLSDTNSVGIDVAAGTPEIVFYKGAKGMDRHRADYALSLMRPSERSDAEVVGYHTPEQKARKEITCELLFFEIVAVGFLGIASVLFKEKGMGVIRIHAVLPVPGNLFLLSKLTVFLLSDLVFTVLLTVLNVGWSDMMMILPAVLLQTAILSVIMALTGLICSLLLKDFRQFTLMYLLITIFAATPVFMAANTPVKPEWIRYHPFYYIYMELKNAYFGMTSNHPLYYVSCIAAVAVLFAGAWNAFRREVRKEG